MGGSPYRGWGQGALTRAFDDTREHSWCDEVRSLKELRLDAVFQ